jgi:hypothetical protein
MNPDLLSQQQQAATAFYIYTVLYIYISRLLFTPPTSHFANCGAFADDE